MHDTTPMGSVSNMARALPRRRYIIFSPVSNSQCQRRWGDKKREVGVATTAGGGEREEISLVAHGGEDVLVMSHRIASS